MPSKSGKQHRFMEMVAHDPKAAKRVGVPQSVGKEFAKADAAKSKDKTTSTAKRLEKRISKRNDR
jgi:hypothetical protein